MSNYQEYSHDIIQELRLDAKAVGKVEEQLGLLYNFLPLKHKTKAILLKLCTSNYTLSVPAHSLKILQERVALPIPGLLPCHLYNFLSNVQQCTKKISLQWEEMKYI